MLTGETITDDQIHTLLDAITSDRRDRQGVLSYDDTVQLNSAQYQCSVALGRRRARAGWSRAKARARCAEIFNFYGLKP